MTPFQLIQEAPARVQSWSTTWKILACSALSMGLAVVLMAWQATRFCAERHHHEQPIETWHYADVPTTSEIKRNMEVGCAAWDHMRVTKTGYYAPDRTEAP